MFAAIAFGFVAVCVMVSAAEIVRNVFDHASWSVSIWPMLLFMGAFPCLVERIAEAMK